jgi:hypothetical protein
MHCHSAVKKMGHIVSYEPKPHLFVDNLFRYEQLRHTQEHALNAEQSSD